MLHSVLSLLMNLALRILLGTLLLLANFALAQSSSPATPQASAASMDYSGMYSFLKDGEFIQITIENQGAVSGFISRFGDSPSDKGTFLDQFLKSGKLDGRKLNFTTETVHGLWFTFEGTFDRGPGKTPDQDGYFILRGTLTRNETDASKKTTSQERTVEFKSFPRDAAAPQN